MQPEQQLLFQPYQHALMTYKIMCKRIRIQIFVAEKLVFCFNLS